MEYSLPLKTVHDNDILWYMNCGIHQWGSTIQAGGWRFGIVLLYLAHQLVLNPWPLVW